MMNDLDTLRPCPFCGSENVIHVIADHPKHAHYILCMMCDSPSAMRDTPEHAAKSWNQRATTTEAEFAALKERIAEAPMAQLIDQGRATQQWYVRATDGGLLALPPALSGKRVRLVVEK